MLALWLLALIPLSSWASCRFIIGYNDEPIPPYILRNQASAAPQGSIFTWVDVAAKKLDCQIIWHSLPNLRVLHATEFGQLDGALFYSWSPQRDKIFAYPKHQGMVDTKRRVATLNYVLYRKAGSSFRWDGHPLQQLSCLIGFNEGWSIGADLTRHGVAVESAKSAEQNLKKLEKGRICGYATLEQAGDDAIAHYPVNLFAKLPIPLTRKEFYLIVNPGSYQRQTPRIEALWDEIGRLTEERTNKIK